MELEEYFESIQKKIGHSTEYTLRTDFENLMNDIKPRKAIEIIQEHSTLEKLQTLPKFTGRPDFRVTESNLEIGWMETKPIHDDISVYLDTPQLKRYLHVIPNFLFTNYREFILFRDGEAILNSTLFVKEEKKLQDSNVEQTKALLYEFFNGALQQIEKTEKLSIAMAKHAQYLQRELWNLWNSEEKSPFKEKFKGLYDLFSKTLVEELQPLEFIDAYSQTVAYGLLLSALSANKKIDKYNFIEFIPKSLPIFEEIFGLLRLQNIPEGIAWIIDKLFIILHNTDYAQVQKELSFSNKIGSELDDPYIYFYENFLKAYNPEKRVEKGVYYTPAPVVHFIVKIIQQSLIKDFKKSGLDDDNISLLDFATGTGTFLLEAFKTALANVDKGQKNGFIRNNLLKNFYGFEYLIAPYTIAHLKLTKFLTEEGFLFEQEGDRAKIFLTDTLDDSHYQRNALFPYLSDEGEGATKVKSEKKIWVVLGNPPYSNFSKNKRPFIQALINDYKKGLNETKINMDDDYIKFIRFAQAKIEGAKYSYQKGNNTINRKIEALGQGIIGIITNNSYLNGITHRQMRKSLYETFDKIYILNLHGNSIIGEGDKNVFDITVGVCIALFVKTPKPLPEKEVYYFSTLNNALLKREEKFEYLRNHDLETTLWKRLKPEKPHYWFVEKDFTHIKQYEKGWKMTDIFKEYSTGIGTKIDAISVDIIKKNVIKRVTDILNKKYTLDDIIKKYKISHTTTWEYKRAIHSTIKETEFTSYNYRPFDRRYVFYNHKFLSRSRKTVMDNFFEKDNLGLICGRLEFYGFITDIISDEHICGGNSYNFPLYIYNTNTNGNTDENGNGYLFKDEEKKDNFTKEFRKFLKENNLKHHTPEQILGYIYAVLFSPIYRLKYFEFLKIDFPKIPFCEDMATFQTLSNLGSDLIDHHLLKHSYSKNEMPTFAVEGNNTITEIHYNKEEQRLYINKTQYFENFAKSVWEYEIGGYQIFDKYLKARKDLELTYEEINHLKKVATCILKTMEIQKNIDTLCQEWM
ncbi:MAG: N-6 DNA methylase [Chitinophagaceae bacterium]|nr:N-6 DNA methylase [Chitinophagaceae bacterium]